MYLSATSLETKRALGGVLGRRSGDQEGRCILILSFVGEARFLDVILSQIFDLFVRLVGP